MSGPGALPGVARAKGGEVKMRRCALATLLVIGASVWGLAASAALEDGVKLAADGKVIDVDVGHLVPCSVDWNEDGRKDLIVGQFSGGRIRLYLNRGTDAEPAFTDFTYLRAGGKEIRLPAG